MAEFTYKVINKKGAEVSGVITAGTREAAVTDLRLGLRFERLGGSES